MCVMHCSDHGQRPHPSSASLKTKQYIQTSKKEHDMSLVESFRFSISLHSVSHFTRKTLEVILQGFSAMF